MFVKLQRPRPEMRIFSAIFSAWSSSRTRTPSWPARAAQNSPAAPAPTTTASNRAAISGSVGHRDGGRRVLQVADVAQRPRRRERRDVAFAQVQQVGGAGPARIGVA